MAIGAILAGLGSAVTNPEVAGNIGAGLAGAFSKSGKAYRRQLAEDRRRLAANDFGMSEAEKNAAVGAANRNQQAQARETEAGLRQQAATIGSRSPAAFEAMRGLGASLAGNLATTRGNIEASSAQLANQQREQALARLNSRRQEVRAQGEQAAQSVATGVGEFEKTFRAVQGAKDVEGQSGALDIAGKGIASVPITSGAAKAAEAEELAAKQRQIDELEARLAALNG